MTRRVFILGTLLLALVTAPISVLADAIDDYIQTEMKSRRIPGLALAVARNGAVEKIRGYDTRHCIRVGLYH